MSPSSPPEAPRRAACPICRRPSLPAFAPFCSPRCKDRDLLNWLGDGYALPGEPVDIEDIALDKREMHD